MNKNIYQNLFKIFKKFIIRNNNKITIMIIKLIKTNKNIKFIKSKRKIIIKMKSNNKSKL